MQKNLLSIGQALKERREAQKIPLKKVADQTKINISLLQAIEEGRVEPFPVHAYLRGFIMAYAKALGMDEKEWAEELKSLSSTEENVHLSEVAGASGPVESLIEKDMRLTPVILATLILFVLGSILVLSNILNSHKEKKALSQQAEHWAKEPEPKLLPEKKPSVSNKVKAHPNPVPSIPPVETKKEPMEEKNLPNLPSSATTNQNTALAEKETVPKETVPKETVPQEQNKPDFENKPTKGLEIIVKALEEVRVHYRVDEGEKESVLLAEDQFRVLKGMTSVFIQTRHSDLIYIFRNGKDLGLFGPGGRKEQIFSLKERKEKE